MAEEHSLQYKLYNPQLPAALMSHSQWRKNVVGSLQGNGVYVKGKQEHERTQGKGSGGRQRKKSKSRKCKKEKSVTNATKRGISIGIAQS